jgi:HSP20 family protein
MPGTLSPSRKEQDLVSFETRESLPQPMELTAVSIDEAEQEYLLSLGAPGMRREDFYVWVDKKTITIIAGAQEGSPYFKDLSGNSLAEYVRTCELPDNADPLLTSATFSNGKLEIHIPKGENTEENPIMIYVY